MYSIDPSSVLDMRAFIAMLILLVPLSIMMLWLRIKGWGVEFTPTCIMKSIFSKNYSQSMAKKLFALGRVTFRDILLLRRAGAWCEEDIHTAGRGMLMWGFSMLVLFSVLAFLFHTDLSPLSQYDPLRTLQDISKLLVVAGALTLIMRRALHRNRRIATDLHTWALQSVFLVLGLTGLSSDIFSIFGMFTAFRITYLLYVSSIAVLLLYYPFSELAFLIWKGSLLSQESFDEELVTVKEGKREK